MASLILGGIELGELIGTAVEGAGAVSEVAEGVTTAGEVAEGGTTTVGTLTEGGEGASNTASEMDELLEAPNPFGEPPEIEVPEPEVPEPEVPEPEDSPAPSNIAGEYGEEPGGSGYGTFGIESDPVPSSSSGLWSGASNAQKLGMGVVATATAGGAVAEGIHHYGSAISEGARITGEAVQDPTQALKDSGKDVVQGVKDDIQSTIDNTKQDINDITSLPSDVAGAFNQGLNWTPEQGTPESQAAFSDLRQATNPQTNYSSMGQKSVSSRPDAPTYQGKDNYDKEIFRRTLLIIRDKMIRATGGTVSNRYNRMQLPGAMNSEDHFIARTAVLPFIVTSLFAYNITYGSGGELQNQIHRIMKDVLKINQSGIHYASSLVSAIPPEFTVAFRRNRDSPTFVSDRERIAINRWVHQTAANYKSNFGRTMYHDVKELEKVGVDIWSLFTELETPRVLHMLAEEAKAMGTQLLQLLKIESVVAYRQSGTDRGNLSLLRDMRNERRGPGYIKGDDSAGLYRVGNDYVVVFNGKGSEKATEFVYTAQALASVLGGNARIVAEGTGATSALEMAVLFEGVRTEVFDAVVEEGRDRMFSHLKNSIVKYRSSGTMNPSLDNYMKRYRLPVTAF